MVEDELALARLYARALTAAGFEVDHATDGSDALARLSTASYDVVLSDVCMPRMGGLDLLIAIRRETPDLPVILMTARLDADLYARARESGTVRYLLKPVSLEKLATAVENGVKLRGLLLRSKERKVRGTAAR